MPAGAARLVTCPKCKAKYDASSAVPGQPITCQKCRAQFTLPAPAAVDAGRAATVKMPPAARGSAAATAVGGKTTERMPVAAAKRKPSSAAVPVPRRERMTPLMRAVQQSNSGVPQNEPRASVGSRGARRQKDNTPLIIGAVAGGLVLVVALVLISNNSKRPPAKTSSSGGAANYGSSTSGTGSTPEPAVPEPAVATASGSPDADRPSGDSPPPKKRSETPPPGDPPGDGTPGADTGDAAGEAPPEEARPDPTWDMSPEVKARVDGLIQELYDEARPSKEINKDIRAIGRDALPPIIETLLDPDPIKAVKASGLLAMLVERNPVSDPTASVEDRRRFYEQEKKWFLRHYYDIQIAEGERSKKSEEDIKAEIHEIVKEMSSAGFSERERCVRLLQKYGKQVVPILIGFLEESDKDFADAASVALQDLTHHTEFGPLPRSGSVAGYIEKWRKWWGENKEKVSIP